MGVTARRSSAFLSGPCTKSPSQPFSAVSSMSGWRRLGLRHGSSGWASSASALAQSIGSSVRISNAARLPGLALIS